MSLVMTTAPTVEPVTLADAKAHLRVDANAEDAFISSLIVTSRLHVEAALGLALVAQSWLLTLDAWPSSRTLELPLRPVLSVQSVAVRNADGSLSTLAPSLYHLDRRSSPPRIVATASPMPTPAVVADGIEVRFTAGYGALAGDVPAPIRHALLLLVAHWFENREPVGVGQAATRIPDTVSELLAPYRLVRL